jgi:hypothetical protein
MFRPEAIILFATIRKTKKKRNNQFRHKLISKAENPQPLKVAKSPDYLCS